MTLGGSVVPIPGVDGAPGVQPRSDSNGNVTFSTIIPNIVSEGVQKLTIRLRNAGDGIDSGDDTTMTIAGPKLTVEPKEIVANQVFNISGRIYSKRTGHCC